MVAPVTASKHFLLLVVDACTERDPAGNLLIGADMHVFWTRQLDANAMPTEVVISRYRYPSIDAVPIARHQSFSGSWLLGAIIITIADVIVADYGNAPRLLFPGSGPV